MCNHRPRKGIMKTYDGQKSCSAKQATCLASNVFARMSLWRGEVKALWDLAISWEYIRDA